MGLSAILHSEMFLKSSSQVSGFNGLVDVAFNSFKRLPWLREDCGHLLVEAVRLIAQSDFKARDKTEELVKPLTEWDMARTPEGLALWLEITANFKDVKMPKKIWHHRDPLSKKEISAVANIMCRHKGSMPQPGSSADQQSSTGARQDTLHFAWDIVVENIIKKDLSITKQETLRGGTLFAQFWNIAVERESAESSHSSEDF